jgi:hypothetical protein
LFTLVGGSSGHDKLSDDMAASLSNILAGFGMPVGMHESILLSAAKVNKKYIK